MRAGIGILCVLIAVAIILMVAFAGKNAYVPTVVNAGQSGDAQASQIAGVDQNGIRAQDSIALQPEPADGQMRGLLVTNILPQGPLAVAYGLMKGDEIMEVGPMRMRDQNDPELAKDFVYEALQRNETLVVQRNGQELTINPNSALAAAHPQYFQKPGVTVTGGAGAAPQTPAAPAPQTPQGQMKQLQQQLQGVPTH